MKPGDKVRYSAPDLDKEFGELEVIECNCNDCQSGFTVHINSPSQISGMDTKHVFVSTLKSSVRIPAWTRHTQPLKIMGQRKSGG